VHLGHRRIVASAAAAAIGERAGADRRRPSHARPESAIIAAMDAAMRTTIHDLLERARSRLDRFDPVATARAVARDGALLVDVRSDAQRARDGTIPGALVIPRNVLEWRADPASGHADPQLSADLGRTVVVMCDEGYQSSLAAATLQDLGFTRATDLAGGFQAWRAAGMPIARARTA
jgi:rhodanese-related sulfurtransferase